MNQLYCGDCAQELKRLADNSIDLTVTSPPYDTLRDYKNYKFNFNIIAEELYRVTKEGGVVVWIVKDATVNGNESGTAFRQALYFQATSFRLHDTMIWEKDTFSFPSPVRYRDSFEYMFILSKGQPKTVNLIEDRQNKYAGTQVHGTSRGVDGITFRKSNDKKSFVKSVGVRFNVWHLATEKHNIYNHPAVFPEKLAEDHILSWSNENDVILDPMAGSGTTLLMAKKHNRQYIGIEISPEYINIIKKRLQ